MKGLPLNWAEATAPQKAKVMDQLVDIFLEIERHPFDSLGSILQPQHGLPLDGFAENRMFKVGSGPLGLFRSQTEADRATVNTYLRMIASGEVANVAPVDVYLVHRFRLDVIQKLEGESAEEEHFFLKHPDDKGDHILVDDSYNITGIVDWEWTRTERKAYAFSSPCMMWPVAKFYEGSNELSNSEIIFADMFKGRGRDDLAEYLLGGRKVQRFYFNFGGDAQDRATS
ncbi:hypothetical protein BJ875DRAFT_466302 [Amylocarpus encephaloides]|uniref:Aminoglycoside phosphotransferase domain-containing protein n=1 Tax=Amylocarpus encephaloides TaxID=45428 RepID=A0A9P7YG43_9HELO|nr:hypothetical protein BJ875DRAFT_466302 [Amylocarpus encephaloides]